MVVPAAALGAHLFQLVCLELAGTLPHWSTQYIRLGEVSLCGVGGEKQNFSYLLSPPPSPASFSKQAFIPILNKFTWVFLEGKQSCSISSRALNLLMSIFNCPICAIYLNSSWQSHGWNMFPVTASIKVTEYFMQLLGGWGTKMQVCVRLVF